MSKRHSPGGIIFRAWITVKGEKIYAKDKNLKAFPIYIGNKKKPTDKR